MRDAGVKVALGVDGSASNDAGHLLSEARQLLLLQRVRNGADAMSARETLEIATLGGAAVLGRAAELGSIEVGKRGDLAIWDVSGLAAAGAWDPVAALVLCGPFQVRDLVVEGRRVVREGQLAGVELEAVVERANRRVARLMG
jgi:cytosine/adenosine deaminase-related metal-dependent hydrolase